MSFESDKRVQDFLARACAKIRSASARKSVRDELLDHLNEAVANGVTVEDALRALGEPELMALPFAQIHRPVYFTPSLYGFALFGLLSCVLAASSMLSRMHFQVLNRDIQATVDHHRNLFLEDQQVLQREPFFALAGKKHDAGAFLNPRIAWDVGRQSETAQGLYDFLMRPAQFDIPKNVVEKLRDKKQLWFSLAQTGVDRTIDLDWMKSLSQYDHWDNFSWAPMQNVLAHPELTSWYTMPIPDFIKMVTFARLRLLRGLRTKNMLPALREVRHLARLTYTNETLIGSMASVAMLNMEREAFEDAVKNQITSPTSWQPISKEVATRARRALYAYVEFFQIGNSDETLQANLTQKFGVAGYCAALAEAAISSLIIRDATGGQPYPFEVDVRPQLAKMTNLIESDKIPCRLTYAKSVYAKPGATVQWLPDVGSTGEGSLLEKLHLALATSKASYAVPWVRQLAMFGLTSVDSPDFMGRPYRNNPLPDDLSP